MAAKKYDLGVAFSGGGAKAAAHCGALQAMKEYGVKPQIVSGTSAGSLVAAFYSAGYEPKEMIELFLGMSFFKDIVTPCKPRGGLFDTSPLLELIRTRLPFKNFEDLPIPVLAVAADMDHGRAKVFSRGELAPRLVASCSIPIVLKPMVISGVHYVDGGVFQNLPIPCIRKLCKKVIAFSVRSMEEEQYKDNLLFTATRAYNMMFMSKMIEDSKLADTLIELNTGNCSVYDVSRGPELFFSGYRETCAALEADGYERIMEPETIVFPPTRAQQREADLQHLKEEWSEKAVEWGEKAEGWIEKATDLNEDLKELAVDWREKAVQAREKAIDALRARLSQGSRDAIDNTTSDK